MKKSTTYGKRLKELRQAARLTQAELAEKVGISLFTLHSHEQDRRMFEAPLLIAYAQALNVSCESFRGCSAPPKKPQ